MDQALVGCWTGWHIGSLLAPLPTTVTLSLDSVITSPTPALSHGEREPYSGAYAQQRV